MLSLSAFRHVLGSVLAPSISLYMDIVNTTGWRARP
jgi:hypothetical protein